MSIQEHNVALMAASDFAPANPGYPRYAFRELVRDLLWVCGTVVEADRPDGTVVVQFPIHRLVMHPSWVTERIQEEIK